MPIHILDKMIDMSSIILSVLVGVAAKKGFVTKNQILEALDIQLTEDFSLGKPQRRL
jgi:hypothetical protein